MSITICSYSVYYGNNLPLCYFLEPLPCVVQVELRRAGLESSNLIIAIDYTKVKLICVGVYIPVIMFVCTCVCVFVYVSACVYVCVCVGVCVFV